MSHMSASLSKIRMRPLVEPGAAIEQVEYNRLMAEIESEMKQSEAEEEKCRQHVHAQSKRVVAIMSADKWVAVVNAKLKGIKESFMEKELSAPIVLPGMGITECQEEL